MRACGRTFLLRPILVSLGVTLVIAGSLVGEARGAETCLPKTAFQKVFAPGPKTEQLTESVDILYYPRAGYYVISHVELRVKDKVWTQMTSTQGKALYEVAERKARQGGYGFYRFRIRTTPEEVEALEKYLQARSGDPRFQFQSCVSGTCRALNRAGVVYIPPPFSKTPLLNALYLRLQSLAGARRIESVRFIGKSQIRALLAPEIFMEAYNLYPLGMLVVEMIDRTGRRVWEWIGIDSKNAEKDANRADGTPYPAPFPTPSASPR